MPDGLQFTNGNTTRYVYDAVGRKLSVTHQTAKAGVSIPVTNVMTPLATTNILATTKTDYCGNVIYEDGQRSRILTEEGYITLKDDITPTYHYFLRDHQGNIRVVIDQAGAVEQVNHYYPFGGLMTEGMGTGVQPYRYNGKELDRMHGLDLYDYGARHYDAAMGRWGTMDPLAEKYYSISPYVYVANNPMSNIDLKGDSISLAVIQQFDKNNGTNYLQTIIYDLQNQTGLTYSVDVNGMLTYNTDKNGNPIVSTTTDINGIIVEQGSVTARGFMMGAINHADKVNVAFGIKSGVPSGSNTIGLSPKQINQLIAGSSNVDSRTLGWGMTLMHELHHTQVGGGLSDTPYSSGNPGPVVTRMNTIRSELNIKGGNYGQRIDYPSKSVGFGSSVLPFSNAASQTLRSTGIIPIGTSYILIKSL